MKKYLKSILCLILALSLVFAVAACGEKQRELIGKTDAEKAAEEAFYAYYENEFYCLKNETISTLYGHISDYSIPKKCVDEHLNFCIDFVEDYFNNIPLTVTSVKSKDSSTVDIEFESGLGIDKLESNRYYKNLLDLLEKRNEYSDNDFIKEFNEIMEDIKTHRNDILTYPSKDKKSTHITMYKEDGKWLLNLSNSEEATETIIDDNPDWEGGGDFDQEEDFNF